MDIIVRCTCGKRIKAREEFAGKLAKCPICNAVLTIPSKALAVPETARIEKKGRRIPLLWIGAGVFCTLVIGVAFVIDKKMKLSTANEVATANLKHEQRAGEAHTNNAKNPAKTAITSEFPQELKEVESRPPSSVTPNPAPNDFASDSLPLGAGGRYSNTPITPVIPTHDPIAQSLLQSDSKKYDKLGFKGYTFGTTIDELRAKIKEGEQVKEDTWVNAENAGLFFSKGRLRGVQAIYVSTDIKGYIDAIKEEFGTATPHLMLEYSTTPNPRYDPINGYLTIKYRFDRVAVYVAVGSRYSTSFVQVQVFDKSYLQEIFNRSLEQKRKLFEDLTKVFRYCEDGNFDWSLVPLPSYDGMKKVVGKDVVNPSLHQTLLIGTNDRGHTGGIFSDQALAVFESEDTGEKKIVIRLDMNRFPQFSKHPLLTIPARDQECKGRGSTEEDNQYCNRILAEKSFPPMNPTIKVEDVVIQRPGINPLALFKHYSWETTSHWDVHVLSNNTIVLIKNNKKRFQ